MNKTLRYGTLALVGATAAGVIGITAPAIADDGTGIVYKRDDESGKVITTADHDDDDDDQATNGNTNTGTNTGAGTNTGTQTNGADTDHSRVKKVDDLTNDGPGKGNADNSRSHTNDGTRHNTRG